MTKEAEGDGMIDLDELNRLHEAATPGEKKAHEDQIWIGNKMFVDDLWDEDSAFIAAIYNAYPKLAARLRAAEALVEVLLTAPEWSFNDGWRIDYCPHCNGADPDDEPYATFAGYSLGHKPDCPRQLALDEWKKARGE